MSVPGLPGRPGWWRIFKLLRWCADAERYCAFLHARLEPHERTRQWREAAEFFSSGDGGRMYVDGTRGFEVIKTLERLDGGGPNDVDYRPRVGGAWLDVPRSYRASVNDDPQQLLPLQPALEPQPLENSFLKYYKGES